MHRRVQTVGGSVESSECEVVEGDLSHVLYYNHYYGYCLLKPSISIETEMCIVALFKLNTH
jgi:hypothetical protein